MNKLKYLLILFLPYQVLAQKDTINYDMNIIGLTSNGVYSPFWLQSNQYGKISSSPNSADLLVGINKEFRKNT